MTHLFELGFSRQVISLHVQAFKHMLHFDMLYGHFPNAYLRKRKKYIKQLPWVHAFSLSFLKKKIQHVGHLRCLLMIRHECIPIMVIKKL